MENKTAIEWLFLKMNVIRLEHDMGMLDDFEFISSQNGVLKKAKEMEKEQIKDTFHRGENTITMTPEEYYNETYSK